ncbi:MAG: hypothetical protein MN733_09330 [Nitrososphaera sp.]|nr:hypothetical protein [Nitrososphaera sp.]
MAHWYYTEINVEDIRKAFPELKEWTVTVQFKDLGWHGLCGFEVTLSKAPSIGDTYLRICEQPGCCGYGNLFYPGGIYGGEVGTTADKRLFYKLAMWCANRLCLSGLQFVGTSGQSWIIDMMKKDGWKVVHSMPNRRYMLDGGSKLNVLCKNLNVYKKGKPVNTRQPGPRGIYG